jgi:hypothetical protein
VMPELPLQVRALGAGRWQMRLAVLREAFAEPVWRCATNSVRGGGGCPGSAGARGAAAHGGGVGVWLPVRVRGCRFVLVVFIVDVPVLVYMDSWT